MQVAIDARNLQDRPVGGIGRVLRNVLPRLAADFSVTLLTDPRRGARPDGAVAIRSVAPSAAAWLQDAAPRWLRGFDGVFHCPFYGLPYRQPVPMVVSLWDLTFEFRSDWFPIHKRVAFRAQARHAARTARRIIVASSVVRDDVITRYHVDGDRIIVAPLAVELRFHPRPPDGPRQRAYVVAFSGAPRRRIGVAIDAWQRAGGAAHCDLVVVGGPSGAPPAPGLVEAGAVDDNRLAELLGGARALLYPTEYEGFGLPALEAQASGAPVVCTRVGALPEVLGGVAAWAESATTSDLAEALRAVLIDDGYHNALAGEGLGKAGSRPGWDVAAAAFARAYREAAA